MDKKTTIYDIAREAGVSTATVTRVTAGSAKVKPSTRERVQRVIDAHGYVPSAAAHALEGGLSNTIAIVMPLSANPYFTRLFNAVYEEAAANGYYAWLFQIRENSPIPRSLIDEIIRRRIDGVIFAGGIWSEERSGLSESLTPAQAPHARRHHLPADDAPGLHLHPQRPGELLPPAGSPPARAGSPAHRIHRRLVTAARFQHARGKLPARAAGAGPAG